MNWKPFLALSHTARVVAAVATVFVSLLALSWLAGQCRTWSTPKPPKPVPPIVDPGLPTPGPAATAPTIDDSPKLARPDLERAELEALAKKYGLTLQPAGRAAEKREQPAKPGETPAPAAAAPTFPMLLAEETFAHHPSGAALDVSASAITFEVVRLAVLTLEPTGATLFQRRNVAAGGEAGEVVQPIPSAGPETFRAKVLPTQTTTRGTHRYRATVAWPAGSPTVARIWEGEFLVR